MATQNMQLPPSRPSLISHQSNSVPSTPYQLAREFRSRSRSPSPRAQLNGSHSPRSVKSEVGSMGSLPRGNPRCKYETAPQLGKRRIQYDIGDEILPKANTSAKKVLNPDEQEKLSGDMRELYDRLLPTVESEARRAKLVQKLERMLRKEWPGNTFTVHVFGSSENMLCTSESDVDICIQTPFKKLESMHMLAAALDTNGMERVVCIASAKVPIVKIWDPELRLNCDINVNNLLALENTRMIKTYIMIDSRVRQLAMIVKHWTKQRILNDAGIGGTLSSYTWICMILNFLQTREPPILPALHQLPHGKYIADDGSESGFNSELDALRDFGKQNTETPAELLFAFFLKYGHEMDYEKYVISVRHGKLMSRSEKGWHTGHAGSWRLCVEEPFNTSRNLGNTADMTAWKGIHLEIRRAFDALSQADLKKCCEQFEYPLETENKTFQKPAPGHRPIAVQLPHSRRNAAQPVTIRAPRNAQGGRSSAGYRRSSSGASFAHVSQPMNYSRHYQFSSQEAYFKRQADLTSRIEILKAQLQQTQQAGLSASINQNNVSQSAHNVLTQAQLHAYAMYQHAQMQAQATHAHPHSHTALSAAQSQSFTSGPPTPHLYEDGRGQQPFFNAYAYPYQNAYEYAPQMSLSASQEGTRTNPSSPSLSSVSLAGRRPQRSGANNALRSQSQPARVLPNPMLVLPSYPPMPHFDATAIAYANQQINVPDVNQVHVEVPSRSERTASATDNAQKTGSPREYLGYSVDDVPNSQVQPSQHTRGQRLPNYHVQPIPSYGEMLRQRAGKEASLQTPVTIAHRRASRSPSPLGHLRSFSAAPMGMRSAPLPSMPVFTSHRNESLAQSSGHGPVIADSSSYVSTSARSWDVRSEPEQEQPELLSEILAEQFAATVTLTPHVQSGYDIFGIHEPAESAIEDFVPDVPDPISVGRTSSQGKVNGSNSISPKPPNGPVIVSSTPLVTPEQFPALSPPTAAAVPASQENNAPPLPSVDSSTPAIKSPWRVIAAGKTPVPPLDLSKSTMDVVKGPNTGPILSPVIETRTPSPSTKRRSLSAANSASRINGIASASNGTYAEAGKVKSFQEVDVKQSTSTTRKAGQASSEATQSGRQKADSPSSSQQQATGQWTTANQKKRRTVKKKSSAPKAGETSLATARKSEPLPANEADRKGG